MSAQTKYNSDYHQNGERFNEFGQQTFNDADETSRRCLERIDQLIDATKREIHNERE